MAKKFNSKTITVTTDSMYEFDPVISYVKYNPIKTELLHDALDVLLNSVNPHRKEYHNMDYNAICALKDKQIELISEMMELLKKSK